MKNYFPFFLILLILVGCNQQSETMNQDVATTDTTAEEVSEQRTLPDYDPAMDLTIMDVEGIEVLGDTLGVKMYIGTLQPGDSVGWHFHPDHTVYVIEGGTMEVYFKGMEKQTMELTSGVGFISPSLSDAAVNTGNTTIKLLTHDIYRPRE
ncbi:hypothetical protein G3570_00455 [Balneolaceae bacterium YR4-1]|uniref:Cupin domain-containing protein n=1 Tax=Halalkalibaculum roseum TaxID=2709311 RepID=A0A6M1SYZ9_9BACT|nr:hypothetical protein [Halalkalibaculum roseum]NGP75085.1 hypothetical protein [Halalkalibaculum roseum]